MVTQVNGYSASTESVTGDWEFVTVYSTHEMAQTGVVQSLADFKAAHGLATGTNISTLAAAKRTFEGSVLANDAAYNDAFAQQANFDSMVSAIGTLAQGVVIGAPVSVATTTNPTTAVVTDFAGNTLVAAGSFGSSMTASTALVSSFTMAVEHADVFGASNTLLEDALNGAPVWATTASGASGGSDEDMTGSTFSAGASVTGGARSASHTNASTTASVVVYVGGNLLPAGYMTA